MSTDGLSWLGDAIGRHVDRTVADAVLPLEDQLTTTARELAEVTVDRDQLRSALTATQAERDKLRADFDAHMATHQPTPDPTPSVESYPMIFGGATTNRQADFDQLDAKWGPIRMSREYDSGNGAKAWGSYSWSDFVRANFKYLALSITLPYHQVPSGAHNAAIRSLLDSWPSDVKGTILIGNEVNAPKKGINPSEWRAAAEYLIDTFGDRPVKGQPQVHWGIAFTNFVSWGQGRTDGEVWLPRRPDKRFVVETHVYGRDDFPSVEDALRTFIPAVRSRPAWLWGIGETSAQEHPTNPDRKGTWLADFADYTAAEGGIYFLPFDTNVGGSADVGTTPRTSALVKAAAQRYAGNDWTA